MDVLGRIPQVLYRASQILRCALTRLRRTLTNLRCTLQILNRVAEILPCALQGLGGALLGLGGALQRLDRTCQMLRSALVIPATDTRAEIIEVTFISGYSRSISKALPDGTRRPTGIVRQRAVLLPNAGRTINFHRAEIWRFCLVIPVAIRRHDGKVLLAGILHRITGHVRVDTILLAGIVTPHPSQTFTSRRGTPGLLREKLGIPGRALRLIEIGNCEIFVGVDT